MLEEVADHYGRLDIMVNCSGLNREEKARVQLSRGSGEAYRGYFQALLDELREKHRFTNARVGQPQNWYTFPSGVPGADYGTSFAQGGRVRVELYIDFEDSDANKGFFDRLYLRRQEFETALGEALSWERLDERRASRVALYRSGSIDATPEELDRIRAWAVEKLLKFRNVFGPKLREQLQSAAGVTQ